MRFYVPDMRCGHCEAAITAALRPVAGQLDIDLAKHELGLSGGSAAAQEVLAILARIGFPAWVIAADD